MSNREQVSVPLPAELREYVQRVAERELIPQAAVIRRWLLMLPAANRRRLLDRRDECPLQLEGPFDPGISQVRDADEIEGRYAGRLIDLADERRLVADVARAVTRAWRLVTPPSNGTPMRPMSTSSSRMLWGRRKKVGIPL